MQARQLKNSLLKLWMQIWTILMVLLPFIIAIGLLWKSTYILQSNSLSHLIFSDVWKPLAGNFGFSPFIVSSLWVSILALIIAGPICVLSAIHLTQYAPLRVMRVMQAVIDILAGIPSVVFGVWGVLKIVPLVSENIAPHFNVETSGYTILSGGIVLAVMVIPFILNILIEIFNTIPKELQEASLSLGASRWYSIKYVIIKKAFPGIISAMGLGLSRAFGETMAVMMVVGNVVSMPTGSLQAGYPLPALIANNYGEMLSIPMYDSALMMAALLLFIIVLIFNLLSRTIIMRYEKLSK